jgi:hypothetical protein
MIIRVPPKLTNRDSLIKYIEIDLWSWLKDLTTGILKLNFKENFQSFTVENVEIPANTQVTIYNQFKTAYKGVIPSGRIITRQQGDAIITDGDLKWTESHVYLKNESLVNDAKISIIFFK